MTKPKDEQKQVTKPKRKRKQVTAVGGKQIEKLLLTPDEVAIALSVSKKTVYRLIREQLLRKVAVGERGTRIAKTELARFIAAWQTKGCYVLKEKDGDDNG